MIKNQFKIAFRTLTRHKAHSLQNIVGLSLALAVCIIGLLYITNEYRYETSYSKADRIYRINTDFKLSGQNKESAKSPDLMGPLWQDQFPEVENFARIFTVGGFKVKNGNTEIREERAAFVDTSLFSMFDLQLLSQAGDVKLSEPNTVVITNSMALKYFGRVDVAGSLLEIDELSMAVERKKTCKIVGVVEDFSKYTQLQFDFLFPLKDLQYGWNRSFASLNFTTFLLLKPQSDYEVLNTKFEKVTSSDIYPKVTKFLDLAPIGWKDFVANGNVLKYALFPLRDIHLAEERQGQLIPSGNKFALTILIVLVAFTMLMATVNFINLSTALAINRAKQIGILKVLGSSRKNLIYKLLLEAFLIVLVSAVIACIIALILLPFANVLLNVDLQASDFNRASIVMCLLGLILLNTILSGVYPAFYLSGIKPSQATQGNNGVQIGGGVLRKSLTLLQFVVAICLITGTVIVYSQLKHLKGIDVGYDREQVYVIDNISVLQKNRQAFRNEIGTIAGIASVSLSWNTPTDFPGMNQAAYSIDVTKNSKYGIPMNASFVDNEYIKALNIGIEAGKNFDTANNFRKVLINESAVKAFGLTTPINTRIYSGDTIGARVIGVVKNFHYESLRQSVSPLILYFEPGSQADFAVIRFNGGINLSGTIEKINKTWKKYLTAESPKGYFMDDSFNNTFEADEIVAQATVWVSAIAICICSIGLFGLITFLTSIKKKELAIRKVLGASPVTIIKFLSRDFLFLMSIAVLIASPISWWATRQWLNEFVYRIDLSVWMFVIGFLIALLITAATVGYQALRAAIASPVDSLKEG